MSQNERFGRPYIGADKLATNCLVLNGHAFTSDELLRRPTPPLLVQSQPVALAPVVAPVDDKRLADLEDALQKTREGIELSRAIRLERTAVKRNRHWYVAGRRVNATDLQGNQQRYFAVASYSTVTDALQALADEIDALHASGKLSESSNSTSSN